LEESIKTTSQNINDTITEIKDSINMASKGIADTILQFQEGIKPVLSVLSIISGIQNGFHHIKKMFKKECKQEGDAYE
jgi:methyl-accepting chemotaxis protein